MSGVYPLPQVQLQIGDIPIRPEGKYISKESSHLEPFYHVVVWKLFQRNQSQHENIGCVVTMKGTDYRLALKSYRRQIKIFDEFHNDDNKDFDKIIVSLCGGLITILMTVCLLFKVLKSWNQSGKVVIKF